MAIMTSSPAASVEDTLVALETALGVHITLYDVVGIFSDASGAPLLSPMRQLHRKHMVCSIGFDKPLCNAHCREKTVGQAALQEEPFLHTCWKNISEIVIPLWWNGAFVGALMAGAFKPSPDAKLPRKLRSHAKLARLYAALPCWNKEEQREKELVLQAAAKGILAFLDEQERVAPKEKTPSRKETVLRYLRYHVTRDCSLEALADELHLSPSRTSHLVQELFSLPLRELVKAERMRRAKSLLLSTDLRVREVALRVGIDNPYHFNRLFRQECGMSPGQYRRSEGV